MSRNLLERVVQRALFYPADMDERFSDLPRDEWSGLPGVFSIDHDVAAVIATHGLWKRLTEETGVRFDLFEDVVIERADLEEVTRSIIDFSESRYRGREQQVSEAVGSLTIGDSQMPVVVETSTTLIDQTLQRLSEYLDQRRELGDDVVASL